MIEREIVYHKDPKRVTEYIVHQFVDNEIDRHNYGILEIEQMYDEVKRATKERDEQLADGGVPTSDPEAVAEWWRDRVERGLRLLDLLDEYAAASSTETSVEAWRKIMTIVEE